MCLPMVQETWVQSQVESYERLKKWYLMLPCLTLSIIRQWSRVKWSNPRKGEAPSLHLGVVAIEKGAFESLSTIVANFLNHRISSLLPAISRVPHQDAKVSKLVLQFHCYWAVSSILLKCFILMTLCQI